MSQRQSQGGAWHTGGKRRVGLGLLAVTGVSMVLGGCGLGHRNFTNENDKLRADKLHLQNQVTKLQRELELSRDANRNLQARLHPHPTTMPTAQIPQLATLQIGRGSGVLVNNHRMLRIYLKTLDAQGRFLPVAGRATVKVVAIPDKGKPVLVAEKTFEPKAFNAAYRATFMGTHYSLDVALPKRIPGDVDRVTVKVIFQQALTGVKLKAEGRFEVE